MASSESPTAELGTNAGGRYVAALFALATALLLGGFSVRAWASSSLMLCVC